MEEIGGELTEIRDNRDKSDYMTEDEIIWAKKGAFKIKSVQ